VVPSLAERWSHAVGGAQLKVVPCSWRATSGTLRLLTRCSQKAATRVDTAWGLVDGRREKLLLRAYVATRAGTRHHQHRRPKPLWPRGAVRVRSPPRARSCRSDATMVLGAGVHPKIVSECLVHTTAVTLDLYRT
jgi:hypothetical protein